MPDVAIVIDAANVIGSRPDGWWRDRAGAAARLIAALRAAVGAGTLHGPLVVVLEGAARAGAPAREHPALRLRVAHAATDGDSAIVAEVTALVADGHEVSVITADRALRDRVRAAGAAVLPPSWLLTRLVGEATHCPADEV